MAVTSAKAPDLKKYRKRRALMGCARSAASLDLHQFGFNCVELRLIRKALPEDSEGQVLTVRA
ncbi:S-methylmethionine-dependent homocysteine/selenocysteine methylase [Acidovorax delafieldii]|nr:S-methylmethionine-dependent homocysteine/selenocysteine methylase [Acidovorax delafieldii]